MNHQFLLQSKKAVVISVFIICVVTISIVSKRKCLSFSVRPRPRTYMYTIEDDHSSDHESLPGEAATTSTMAGQRTYIKETPSTTSNAQPVLPTNQTTPCRNPNLVVLGRSLDTCAASEAVKLAEEEDLYVSIKTTSKNNSTRMLTILLTWLQTINPKQIHVVTDVISDEDVFYQVASKLGIDVVQTDCFKNHSVVGLCCKSRNEYFRYFNTTTASGDLHRWYCHFDDDTYANIRNLVPALREAMTWSKDGGVYFGRWPKNMVPGQPNGARVPLSVLKKLGFDIKAEINAKWATGAGYCVSSVVMKKVKNFLSKHTYEEYCDHFHLNDDVTAAVLIGIAGYYITDNTLLKSHYDNLAKIPASDLPKLITSSEKVMKDIKNVVHIPDARFSEKDDETRFLSYHCLLYPSTSWCRNPR